MREAARAFTGFDYDWNRHRYRFDPDRHDNGVKTVFGHRGRFGPDELVDLYLRHPAHAPFLVRKLWGYFIATPPPPRRRPHGAGAIAARDTSCGRCCG